MQIQGDRVAAQVAMNECAVAALAGPLRHDAERGVCELPLRRPAENALARALESPPVAAATMVELLVTGMVNMRRAPGRHVLVLAAHGLPIPESAAWLADGAALELRVEGTERARTSPLDLTSFAYRFVPYGRDFARATIGETTASYASLLD